MDNARAICVRCSDKALTIQQPIPDNIGARACVFLGRMSRAPTHSFNDTENDASAAAAGMWRTAIRLLTRRQRASFASLTVARITVGLCDVALAAAVYLLFLLLQGRAPTHAYWWIPKTVLTVSLFTSALVVFRALADICSARFVLRYVENLHQDFLLRLTRGYTGMQWSRFVERNRSELTHHALNTSHEAAEFYHRSIELVAGAAIVSAMAAAIVYQSLAAAAAFACALAAFYCVHKILIRRRVQQAASDRERSLGKLHRLLAGVFLAGKDIRAYGNEEFFHERIRREAQQLTSSGRRAANPAYAARAIADQGTMLLFLCVVIGAQLRHVDSRELLSLLAFYFALSRRLLPLVSQLSLIAGQMEGSFENVKIVDAELKECRTYPAPVLPQILPLPGFALEIEHVNFQFDRERPILRDVSLSLRKGESVVLYGASGIGKSSLLNLIAGISPPDAGIVRVDRTKVVYVPQETALLDDSIRNNLLFGLPSKSDEELMRALLVVTLSEFVAAQPLGLDTQAGDNGALFSGGQRQRLGLARALLRGRGFLLLDEATSALDQEAEHQILDNLRTMGKTILLVTHRAHARSYADRVFRLEKGSLVAEINHPPPIRKPGSPVNSVGTLQCRYP